MDTIETVVRTVYNPETGEVRQLNLKHYTELIEAKRTGDTLVMYVLFMKGRLIDTSSKEIICEELLSPKDSHTEV